MRITASGGSKGDRGRFGVRHASLLARPDYYVNDR
jgi:hypothetical protein